MGGCSGTGLGDELGALFWNRTENELGGVFLNWKLTWKLCPETRLVVLHCFILIQCIYPLFHIHVFSIMSVWSNHFSDCTT